MLFLGHYDLIIIVINGFKYIIVTVKNSGKRFL